VTEHFTARTTTGALQHLLRQSFAQAERPLLLLDYDGTLVPFAPRPELALPDSELLDLMRKLCARPHAHVCVISGRDRFTLESWFGQLDLTLVAEHGAWIRSRGHAIWRTTQPVSSAWKPQVKSILRSYVRRTPGSLVENKEFSMAWHYRQCNDKLGASRAALLLKQLRAIADVNAVQILEGNKVVEVRKLGVNKGATARAVELALQPDFILAAGDDRTDEDLFAALPSSAFSIRVGDAIAGGRFSVRDPRELRSVLCQLI